MIYLTMMIFVKEGKEAVFHQFEEFAIPLLEDYNGKLIYRIRPTKDTFVLQQDELPYEIHFLSFESEDDFLNFTKDERRKDFLHLKEESIRYSYLIKGTKL
ncbi:DUF1330 domain-containing protein [Aquimarina spongiae]|uniref:DUF1330 domain-containing protein n=1 Tax=Aquimarina spongiae TaxID=570521 RepID=A0A1M6I354_9FLAO|nr:DUF1330 domain-containing protein [Aquimarina spongiae]SHJ28903.1 hypothetical protein SAMN04488508_10788 [Aquimarina spongiae]